MNGPNARHAAPCQRTGGQLLWAGRGVGGGVAAAATPRYSSAGKKSFKRLCLHSALFFLFFFLARDDAISDASAAALGTLAAG